MRFLADLKYSTRSLVRSPGLALALLLTIAIGVGSNAAVFGFVRGLVTRDLPLAHRDRLVSFYARQTDGGFGPLTHDEYRSLRDRPGAFELIGALQESHASVVLGDVLSVRSLAIITPQVSELLQLPRGRIVVSDRLWRHDLGSRSDVQSVAIRVDGVDAHVAGVAPEWLEGLYVDRAIDVWMQIDELTPAADSASRTLWALGQLRDGISMGEAQQAINSATDPAGSALAIQRYTGATPEAGAGLARVNRSLVAAAIAVFFMACANVAAFLLSRATARSHETSVRVALGAGRPQLRRQLLADSVLIAGAGGGCGGLLAFWTMELIPSLFFDQHAELLVFAPDVTAIVIASLGCAALMAACGLVPLLHVRDDRPAQVLVREGRGPSNAMRRVRTGLVVAQMACCSLLVISTALLIDGFRAALRTSTGQRLGDAVLATVDAGGPDYFQRVNEIAAAAGTTGSAWMSSPPGSRATWSTLRIEPPNLPVRDAVMDALAFTPEWLDRVELPPRAGRMFGRRDLPGGCRAAIVNDVAAAAFFDDDPVGRSIEEPAGGRVEIVGVVATPRPEHRRPLIFYYAEQIDLPPNAEPRRFRVPLRPAPATAVLTTNIVSAPYFETMTLPVTEGGVFGDGALDGGCRVAVINDEAAQRYFNGRAVGGALIDRYGQRTQIIGVVRSRPLRLAERRPGPALYLPVWQDFVPRMTLMAGFPGVDDQQVHALERRLTAVQGGMVRRVVTLEQHLSVTALAPERIAATLVGASAVMALVLAVLGMYSAMADSMRQRRREVALRIALGARGWRLIRQVLVEGFSMAAAGTVAGLMASALAARWLELTPPTLRPGLWVFVIAPLALTTAVLVASVLPMRRALAVDPLTIMRDA